jgi:methylase of polypeptide subunit release factors
MAFKFHKRRKEEEKETSARPSTSLSHHQEYAQVCLDASNHYELFNIFKRDPIYTRVLEHVSKTLGKLYLDVIKNDPDIFDRIEAFKSNDIFGSPRVYDYPDVGFFSPTTLRYVKVLVDLKKYFHTVDELKICEIGVGYGGQCLVINSFYKPQKYTLIDISPALQLTKRYLDNQIVHSSLEYKTMNELETREYDLIISNYAFSELNRSIQDVYLQRVILNSKMGYITYNEITPEEYNSYKANELIEIIPHAQIFEEIPLTHPQNCIIVWGND